MSTIHRAVLARRYELYTVQRFANADQWEARARAAGHSVLYQVGARLDYSDRDILRAIRDSRSPVETVQLVWDEPIWGGPDAPLGSYSAFRPSDAPSAGSSNLDADSLWITRRPSPFPSAAHVEHAGSILKYPNESTRVQYVTDSDNLCHSLIVSAVHVIQLWEALWP